MAESVDPEALRALLLEHCHVEVPSVDTDLLESGALDSLQLVELLLAIEQRFGFSVPVESIELEDMRSLARLAELAGPERAQTRRGMRHG